MTTSLQLKMIWPTWILLQIPDLSRQKKKLKKNPLTKRKVKVEQIKDLKTLSNKTSLSRLSKICKFSLQQEGANETILVHQG